MPAQRKSWLAALLLAATGPAWANNAYHNLEAGSFAQDWSNAALITANDDWSGVPSVIGYRGDGLAGGTGVDPQTILGEGTPVVDVNVNQTNPNTFTTGGVTEFAITDAVVAQAGSNTARAPALVIHLNTSNRYNIAISYNLRDIDGSADNSIQPIALQYRIGSSGNFTNVPAGFVADASSGPNLATLVTPVSLTLPAAVENQPQVQLRIITSDAVGSDEWIGVDDILIFGDPPPPPAVTIADASVAEGNPPGTTTLTFTATIPAPIADNCVFRVENFGTPPGTLATPGVDYEYPSPDPQVTIPAGQTSASFDVTIVRDTLVEGDEQFVLSAYGEPSACDIFGMGDIIGTIIDDDAAAPPDISIDDVSLAEGNAGTTVATLTVSLSAPAPAGGVSVNYATADGSATTALADYTAASGTLNFAPGDASETITVNLTGDAFFEADETLLVNLSGAVGGNLVDNQGQVTIQNDDAQPQLTVDNVTVIEGTGGGSTNAVFTVSLTGAPAPGGAVTVDFASAAGSAISGTDFTAANGTLTYTNGGALTQTVSVPITRDNIDEDDESFTVGLSNAVNAQIEVSPGTGTIQDDDTAVVSINNVSQNEGNAGTAPMNFTVSLSVPAASPRFFGAFTADGTAVAPGDYIELPLGPTSVVFAPGETTKTVTVQINGDTTVEADETFTLNLADAAAIEGGNPPPTASGTGTIINDDAPSVSIDDASVTEGTGAGATLAVFTVTLTEQPQAGSPVTVNYASTGITAISGTDFTATSGSLTFTSGGALTQTISVPITRDNIDEDDELFALDILATGANVTDGKGEGSIVDDDTAVVSINNVSQDEGNAGTTNFVFTLSLSTPSASTLEYSVFTTDGSASAGSDYVGIPAPGNTVVFPPLSTTQTISVTVNGDTTVEADETFNALVLFALPVIEGGPQPVATGLGTIVNDDVLVDVSINDASGAEGTGAGSTNALFTVTLSAQPPVGAPVTVNYSTAGGSAISGTDFTEASGSLTFTNGGALTQTISVPVTRDNIDENDEGFVIDITAPAANVTDAQGAGTIVDDDTALVSVSSPSQNEGNSGQSPMPFTVSLSTPSASTLTYVAFTADGSATAPGDYLAIPPGATSVTFVPGDVSESVTVQIVGDSAVEPDETLRLNLTDSLPVIEGGPTVVAFGTGTIVNDDVLVAISINDVTVTEGTGAGSTNAVFTVTASQQPAVGVPLTVNYATAGGTAASATDFTATSGTLTFTNGGALTQSISVPVTRDNIDESDEGFVVNLTAPAANVTDGQGAGTIVDDDALPTPTIGNISVTEGNSGQTTATFTVSLSNPSAFALAYQASTVDGTAVAPGDYQAIAAGLTNVSFAPLQTTQTISVNVVGELLVEANETLTLNLRAAVPTEGAPPVLTSATATINNDDSATLSISGSSGPEGNAGTTPRQFTATLSNPVQAQVQVNYATADGSATVADNDYQAANGTLTFAGATTTQSFNVNVVGDLEVEPDQSFAVALSGLNAPTGVTLGTATATSTIVNDDSTSFSIAGASVTEGTGGNTTLSFVVSLSAPAKDPVSVQYATVNGSALAPADYTAANGTLTFNGGQITQNIAITVIGDNLVEADEALQVQLSNPTGGTLVTAIATGTIVNDDNAALTINDVTLPEGNGHGSTPFVFTISASNPSTTPITVNYQTSEGSAVTPNDFAAGSGSATIPAMSTSVNVTVNVVADSVLEPDETFTVTLSNAQGATIGDAVGIGTILGDDALIPVPALAPRSLELLIALVLALGMVGIARRR